MWSLASNALRRLGSGNATASSLTAFTGATRGFYWPRKKWFNWKQTFAHDRQAALRKKRHIWPRRQDADEAPIFGHKEDGRQLAFRAKELRLSLKRLLDYARLIRDRQLEDAIDWVESLARLKSEPILKLLRDARTECTQKFKMDPARLYIFDAQPQRGSYVKSLRRHSRGKYGIMRHPRHMFMVRIWQMPLEEYFHKMYVFNKVPRSLTNDMRLSLHQGQVSSQMKKEWAPYLCANARLFHRKELKWLDSTRQWDYYDARREWIQKYKANLMRGYQEARVARGLPPLPISAGD